MLMAARMGGIGVGCAYATLERSILLGRQGKRIQRLNRTSM